MSDERKGGPGGGPKRPRATFGDVMLGIASGRPGEERKGGRRDAQGSEKPREERARGDSGRPSQERERGRKPQRREGGKPAEAKKPQGPLVVVKRATGAVETRSLESAAPVPAPTSEPEPTAAPTETQVAAPEPVVASTPAEPRPSVADEIPETESFAEMFEQAAKAEGGAGRRQFRVGERVKGKIFQLGADTAFVSLGGKSEAMIDLRELMDEEQILRFGVGDEIEAHVVETGAKGIILSRQLSKGAASLAALAEARLSGIPVEGLVLSVNKGGLEVAVGDVRAFCPASQVDLRFIGKLDEFVGEKLQFRVMEIRERNVVLSRRALLEEEQKAKAAETRKSLAEGKVVQAKVTSVRDFGAFVDLGGVEGLIPVSELSHVRVGHPSEVVKVGDDVEVEVLKIEPPNPNSPDKAKQKERITLSMRARMEDPWKVAAAELKEGDRVKGKVVRLQPFGAFVELRPGVDGLIHISALSERRIAHPRDVVQVGQEVTVAVEKIDPNEKRIGLRLVSEDEASRPVEPKAKAEPSAPRPKVGQLVTGTIDRIEPYGVFLTFPGGKGLVPASETGTERGTDMKRAFQLGQELKVQVVEIEGSGKIRLSVVAAQKAEERADLEAWKSSQKAGGGKGFGTLGDLLRGRKL